VNNDLVRKVNEIVCDDRRFTIPDLSLHFPQISRTLLYDIVSIYVGRRRPHSVRRVYNNLCPATMSASKMAANMLKNILKKVESDNNKILYETLLDFFLQRNGTYFRNMPRISGSSPFFFNLITQEFNPTRVQLPLKYTLRESLETARTEFTFIESVPMDVARPNCATDGSACISRPSHYRLTSHKLFKISATIALPK